MTNKQDINFVRDIPDEYIFVSDTQDVEAIKEYLGEVSDGYDSFFVLVGDGDYDDIYGMFGIVPWLSRRVYRIP